MAIRVVVTQHVAVYDDAEKKDCLYGPELKERTHDVFAEHNAGKFIIANGDSLTLSFGSVQKVYGYSVELQPANDSTAVPSATLDESGQGPLPLEPSTNPGVVGRMYDGGTDGAPVSSLVVANTGGTALEGRFVVWGDPTP